MNKLSAGEGMLQKPPPAPHLPLVGKTLEYGVKRGGSDTG